MTRHKIDPTALIFGLLYSGIAVVLFVSNHVSFHGITWLGALIPLAMGAVIITNAIMRLSRLK